MSDLRLIWSLSLNRNPFRISGFLNIQGATQAINADQRDLVVQHCRSLSATAERNQTPSALTHASQLPFGVPINNRCQPSVACRAFVSVQPWHVGYFLSFPDLALTLRVLVVTSVGARRNAGRDAGKRWSR